MNYEKLSSSVFELWLNGLFPLFFVFFLDDLLIKVDDFGRSCTWHSPTISRITSFINWLSVSFFSLSSFSVRGMMVSFLEWFFFFVDRTHPMYPIDFVLLFPFAHSVSTFIAFDFFAVTAFGKLFHLLDFGL